MYVYCSDAAWKNTYFYIGIYIIVFLFSRQMIKNMAAYFLNHQAAHPDSAGLGCFAQPFPGMSMVFWLTPPLHKLPMNFLPAGQSGVNLRNKLTSFRDLGSLSKCSHREGGCQRAVVELGSLNPVHSGRKPFKHHRNSCRTTWTATLEGHRRFRSHSQWPWRSVEAEGLPCCVSLFLHALTCIRLVTWKSTGRQRAGANSCVFTG